MASFQELLHTLWGVNAPHSAHMTWAGTLTVSTRQYASLMSNPVSLIVTHRQQPMHAPLRLNTLKRLDFVVTMHRCTPTTGALLSMGLSAKNLTLLHPLDGIPDGDPPLDQCTSLP